MTFGQSVVNSAPFSAAATGTMAFTPGARAVNLNNYPWNVNTNIGARCACDLETFRRVALRSNGTTNANTISQNALPVLAEEYRWGKYEKGRGWLVAESERRTREVL